MAPSCFAQQVPDVKGLQDPGPPCASVSCSNFAHAMATLARSWSPFGFSQLHPRNLEAVNFVPGTTVLRALLLLRTFFAVY